MKRAPRASVAIICLATLLVIPGAPSPLAADDAAFENLQVLPEEITRRELIDWMLGNLRGLGLPRVEGRGCLHCHVGELGTPRDEWDFVSDEKEAKRVARRMMAMVIAINETYLDGLEGRDDVLRVTCATCHAGRINPKPLDQVLFDAYDEGGVEQLISTYDNLWTEYYGGGSYDFRVDVLAAVAGSIGRRGALDDAVAISARNEAAHPDDPAARLATNRLKIWQALDSGGAEAGLEAFRRLMTTEAPDQMTWAVLDHLGWGAFRAGQHEIALALFRENRSTFPEEYVPLESLVDARLDAGEIDTRTAIELYENWLATHPDQERARNRITNLRSGD